MPTGNLKSEYRASHGFDLIISVFSMAYEASAFVAFFDKKISFAIYLLFHVLLLVILYFLISFFKYRKLYIKNIFILSLNTAFLGPFGSAMSTLILMLNILMINKTNKVQAFMEEIKHEQYSNIEILIRRLEYTRYLEKEMFYTEPFEDIITYGSTKEKQSALLIAKRYFRPEFLSFVQKASEDKDNTIRVLSATIISSIRKSVTEQLNNLKTQIEENPNNISLLSSFVNIYKYFILNSFIKNDKVMELADIFINSFRKQLNFNSENITLKLLFIELLTYHKIEDEAKNILIGLAAETHKLNELGEKPLITYLSMLYHYSYFNELRAFAEQYHSDNKDYKTDIISIMEFWKQKTA